MSGSTQVVHPPAAAATAEPPIGASTPAASTEKMPWLKVKALTHMLGSKKTTAAPPSTETPVVHPQQIHQHQRLKIFVGTWNMYGRLLPIDLEPFLTSRDAMIDGDHAKGPFLDNQVEHPYHLLAIGTQECERDISEALFYPSKEVWEARLAEFLGPSYEPLACETLAALHLAVFVWKPIASYVKHVHSESIKTGWANMIGNKGAVAISVEIGSQALLFINCHLRAHQTKLSERNANVQRILSELPIRRHAQMHHHHHHDDSANNNNKTELHEHASLWKQVVKKVSSKEFGKKKKQPQRNSTTSIATLESRATDDDNTTVLDHFDHVFLFGDTNYRIGADRDFVLQCLQKRDIATLLKFDQLSVERQQGGPLAVFKEHPIYFMPTYKFDTSDQASASSTSTTTPTPTSTTAPTPTPTSTKPATAPASVNTTAATAAASPKSAGSSSSSFWISSPNDVSINASITYDTSPKQRVPSWTDRILWYDRARPTGKVRRVKSAAVTRTVPNAAAATNQQQQQQNGAGKPVQKKIITPWLSMKKKSPSLPARLVNKDTICYHYDAVMDHRLVGASDHFPVVGVFGVWFDDWQAAAPPMPKANSKKAWQKLMSYSFIPVKTAA
ncbi:Endonuclease/exonuclease/phosphatase [Gongronella butleri]|nr:Endonuclease/exonuclease/phosphatase [Gongronella butleri]